jgi:hypothetical protein
LYGYVSQRQLLYRIVHEARLLADGLYQREPHVRQHDGERNAWKSGAGASIDYMPGVSEMAPREHGVEHMLDCGLASVQDAREVEVAIGLDYQFEVLRRDRNYRAAVRQVIRK